MTKKLITKSLLAGFLIGIAACIYLSCENKFIGALLFSIGLYAVCEMQAKLFTGVVGNISSKKDFVEALIILLFNIIAAVVVGVLFRLCISTKVTFENVVDSQPWYQVLFESSICGALIYIAVTLYKQTNNVIALILPVMAFILSGSLHSIACSTYIVLGAITFRSALYLVLIILGNTIGALLIRGLHIGFKKGCINETTRL